MHKACSYMYVYYCLQERHLQDVIQAKQTTAVKKKAVYIPTPEAAIPVEHYDQITRKINRGHQYVRVPGECHQYLYVPCTHTLVHVYYYQI